MTTLTLEQIETGVRRLLAAIDGAEAPTLDLEEGLELAHLSRDRWQDCLEQLRQCQRLTRRQLGLRDDGSEGWDDLPDGSPAAQTARGLRVFLRRMATLVPAAGTLEHLAAELHAIVYGQEAAFAPVTWQDYVTVLHGRDDAPGVDTVRAIAVALRSGVTTREAAARFGHRKEVEGISRFLGLGQWREESRLRAARHAVARGWSGARLAVEYNRGANGADTMTERTARSYLGLARDTLPAGSVSD